MTDSMKFGPEWLRNMSTDTFNSVNSSSASNNTSSNSINVHGSSSASMNNLNGSGNYYSSAANNSSPSPTVVSSSLIVTNTPGVVGNVATPVDQHMPSTRNLFPEFRYGREEMLSLFDKTFSMPEILPTYKKIFVEKVQYPLALVPSTDEEMVIQGQSVPTQRPAWLQRSPIGFGSSTRGTGRGGSVDRGRMRGKSIYHTIYQRPIATFEDDIRSGSVKSERNWSERNGASGDGHTTSGSGPTGNSGLISSTDWNGTSASSPRKDFSSHSRNFENWRRNRTDDVSGDASTGGVLSSSLVDGWRGGGGSNSNSFGNSHRWGRSASWRDEEILSGPINDTSYSGVGNTGSFAIQRSCSSTSASLTDRVGGVYMAVSGSVLSKNLSQTSTICGGNLVNTAGRNLNFLSGGGNQGLRSGSGGGGIQWPQVTFTADDDNLPEWATENLIDSGGTFDSSGAFHGSLEEEVSTTVAKSKSSDPKAQEERTVVCSDIRPSKTEHDHEKKNKNTADHKIPETIIGKTKSEADISVTPTKMFLPMPNENRSRRTPSPETEQNKNRTIAAVTKNIIRQNDLVSSSEVSSDDIPTITTATSPVANTVATSAAGLCVYHGIVTGGNITTNATPTVADMVPTLAASTLRYHEQVVLHSDFSDRMKEVADDMVEKLIMDDDGTTTVPQNLENLNGTPPIAGKNGVSAVPKTLVGSTPSFLPTVNSILKQTASSSQHQSQVASVVSVSPTVKATPLYGGGVVIDHATMQHHLQQQELAAAAAAATGLPTPHHEINSRAGAAVAAVAVAATNDLWYYRDPQSKVQGPFAAIEMAEWYRAGYFNENLYVRRFCDTRFRALGELIKLCHGNMPFTNSHLISPTSGLGFMDNMPVTAVPSAAAATQAQVSAVTSDDNTSELSLKQQQRNDQNVREDLKGNVTAAANSISDAMKNLINSVDMSHMLDMHFQMLQEQYICHQEMTITTELLKNECFQRLSPPERDAIVHQKVRIIGLPEYLTSLTALSNTLATLNPTAGIQLYDAIAAAQHQQLPRATSNAFLVDTDDFVLNSHQQHAAAPQFSPTGIPSYGDFLSEEQLLAAATVAVNTSQNPMMQMWLPHQQQEPHPQIIAAHHQQLQTTVSQCNHGEWTGGPLVGIPSAVMGKASTALQPASMWDAPLEEKQQLEIRLQQHPTLSKEIPQSQLKDRVLVSEQHSQKVQQLTDTMMSAIGVNNSKQRKEEVLQLERHHISNHKRNNSKQQMKQQVQIQKDESSNNQRRTDDERRRESTDEKRRQKEERRRQQAEEDKRRLQQAEDEKRRQLLEEKERQQQIQAQRRKAMLGTQTSVISTINTSSTCTTTCSGSKLNQQQRIQSSIAPWSMQTTIRAVDGKPGPPCLAEIQKAERRERRADQQRQTEMLDRQVRCNTAATAEAIASMLKWNASPVSLPVKSFVEIQAEEAKRFSTEQLALHRRKQQEQEQQVALLAAAVNVGTGGVGQFNVAAVVARNASNANTAAGNISAIWATGAAGGSNNKVWPAGFWEEPVKFSAAVAGSTSTATIVGTSNASSRSEQYVQPQQQKSATSLSKTGGSFGAAAATRNLRKSQTVSVMQNAFGEGTTGKNSVRTQQQTSSKHQQGNNSQKNNDSDKKSSPSIKKPHSNNCNNNGGVGAAGLVTQTCVDDLENEFTMWCIKSLNNMNTKIDVPTFVTFLQDLESPYEVKDYIRMYLGESKEFMEFAKHFLERRSKYKNLQRAQNAHNDDMCKPAPAITPSIGNENSDNKGKQKKVKKNKMTKLDARILGFSVTAAEGRINVGDRDYVDAP